MNIHLTKRDKGYTCESDFLWLSVFVTFVVDIEIGASNILTWLAPWICKQQLKIKCKVKERISFLLSEEKKKNTPTWKK